MMKFIKQDDYDSFKCIKGECPKSCCEGWQIVIDEDSLEKYDNNKTEFGKRLRSSIDWEEEAFIQNDRKCVMLNKDGLCDLHCELGEEYLCNTCKMYPRHVEEYEDVRELSLSLSCPEVARMVVERKEKYHFIENKENLEDDFEDFDYFLFTHLCDIRNLFYEIIQNRSINIFSRMEILLRIGKQVQEAIDSNSIFEIEEIYSEWNKKDFIKDFYNEVPAKKDISKLFELETLENDWIEYIDKAYKYDKNIDYNYFINYISKDEEISLENILFNLIFTYLLGAVYDDEVMGKIGLCVYSTIWIYEIYLSRFNLEKELEMDKNIIEERKKLIFINAVYRYAREIEHSDNNLNDLEYYFSISK